MFWSRVVAAAAAWGCEAGNTGAPVDQCMRNEATTQKCSKCVDSSPVKISWLLGTPRGSGGDLEKIGAENFKSSEGALWRVISFRDVWWVADYLVVRGPGRVFVEGRWSEHLLPGSPWKFPGFTSHELGKQINVGPLPQPQGNPAG